MGSNDPTVPLPLLTLDTRRRLSMGVLAKHDRYLADVRPDGTIVLTPAVVMPLATAIEMARGTSRTHCTDWDDRNQVLSQPTVTR